MSSLVRSRTTVEEYLAFERSSEVRHEFLDGDIFAMSGASLRHNLLTTNLTVALHGRLKGRDCSVVSSDQRVRIPQTDLFTYPDVVVFCGEPQLDGDPPDTLLDPQVLIEVLSESTETYDRIAKFAHYRTLDSLRHYVLVAQDRPHVECYTRQAANRWELWVSEGPDDALHLSSLDIELPLPEIYDGLPSVG